MRLLLDTNVIIWLLTSDSRIKAPTIQRLDKAEEVYYSTVSIWEIAIKAGLGKLNTDSSQVVNSFKGSLIQPLLITPEHVMAVQYLSPIHSDPFNRMLVVQAGLEGMTLLTGDKMLKGYSPSAAQVMLLSEHGSN